MGPEQGMAEAEVHTLQTGWCRYAGQDAAKRTNVWLLTQARFCTHIGKGSQCLGKLKALCKGILGRMGCSCSVWTSWPCGHSLSARYG